MQNKNIWFSAVVALCAMVLALIMYCIKELPLCSIHEEVVGFLYNYSLRRPWLQVVFDPMVNDWGMYQARELSYFLDMLDAKVIIYSWVKGWYHLVSISALIMLGGTVWLQQYYGSRFFPNMPRPMLALLSFCYVLLPCSGIVYFRSAKSICALFVTLLACISVKMYRQRTHASICDYALIGISLAALALGDRQGMFIVASYVCLCALLCIAEHHFKDIAIEIDDVVLSRICMISFVVFVFAFLYDTLLGPAIIHLTNGYYPSAWYQCMQGVETKLNPGTFAGGGYFLMANVGRLFFPVSSPRTCLFIGLAVTVFGAWRLHKDFVQSKSLMFHAFIYVMLAMLACSAGMYLRHPAIVWNNVIFSGYFRVFASLLFFFILVFVTKVNKRILGIYCCAFILVAMLPIGKNGELDMRAHQIKEYSVAMLDCIKSGNTEVNKQKILYRYRLLAERILALKGKKVKYSSPGEANVN